MIADIFVFLFVLAFVCFGYKSGILKTCVGFFSYFISVAISAVINPSVSAFVRKTFVADMIYDFVLKRTEQNKIPQTGIFAKIADTVTGEMASGISVLLINVVSFVLTLVICRIILHLITKAVKIVSHLPVISAVNRICGGILGGLEGILILYIASVLLLFLPAGKTDALTCEIENSKIANKIYTENIITDILGKDLIVSGKDVVNID